MSILREESARAAHELWSHWMMYMYRQFTYTNHRLGDETLPGELVRRWKRQMYTDYDDLTEAEKESDREVADKFILPILAKGRK